VAALAREPPRCGLARARALLGLADIAVSTGAILLAIVLWNEEEERVTDAKAVPSTESPTST